MLVQKIFFDLPPPPVDNIFGKKLYDLVKSSEMLVKRARFVQKDWGPIFLCKDLALG